VTRRQRSEDLTAFAVPEQPALSPDGTEIVYVLRTVDADEDRDVRALWQVGARDGEARQLTRGTADSAPAWSPDGTRIAFVRAQDGPPQIWLLPARGGEPERLTTLPLGAGGPVWSPDGTKIAFCAPVDPLADAGEDDAARRRRTEAPVTTRRLGYQADGAGLFRTVRAHLHVLDVETRECRQVTDGDWHAEEPAWSLDSTRLAFPAATAPDADLTFRCPVHVLDVTDRDATPALVALAEGTAGPLIWTADGSALLVVGVDHEPVGHAALLRVPFDDGAIVNLTARLDRNVMTGGPAYPGAPPQLGGDGVLFCARDRGCTYLFTVEPDGGVPRPVVAGAGRMVAGLSVAGDTAAIVLATPTSFGEIVTVDLLTGAQHVRTAHGEGVAEQFPREEREFPISDGTTVHGWLLRDPDRDPAAGPGPLLLDIHGGPHNAWHGAADEVHLYHQELVARGWTVLLVNPRASDGYGEAFFTATAGGWGEVDEKDFLEPVDQLVAEGIADPKRLGVVGYSYGGFMTCFLTGRDDRFAAAVAGGLICDLTSMVGTSDAGHYIGEYELGGAAWADRDHYAALSPITRVTEVATPTLVVHGGADRRCPIGQAQQWHTALRERGVPTELVLYPDAAHLFLIDGRPSHRIDYNRRVVDWMERYAAGRPARVHAGHWQRRLAALATKYRVPGAALGILRLRDGADDELVEAAHGVLSVDTGVAATADSVFQLGSITKTWIATVVLQLVEEGKLDLDAPIVDVLPELRLSDVDVTARVTMRHLLTHTSGIDGDVFTDTGRGDDCVEKYVAALADVAQNHPLGATFSYCNSGYVLAGRVIEKLTGGSWDAAIRERLVGPLGLTHTGTLPEEALLHRAAVGHPGGDEPAATWVGPRAIGPAGLINSTVREVLAFARLHLTGGLAPDGTRLLSAAGVAAMTESQVALPERHPVADSWGLGWMRMGWDGRRLIGHDGNTIGQSAFLRLLPEAGLAVTLLTNGGNTRDLFQDLFRELFTELADVAPPPPLAPPDEPVPVDIAPHVGTYERAGERLEVIAEGPVLRTTETGALAEVSPDPVTEYPLVPIEENLFLARDPASSAWLPVTFSELPNGERYVHFGVRATPRVGG
jgi:dipeptidyl aminopeptidase/acylaminoacyl peptidase/CubicO group peptidase (beta-lactamase class C family)